ncbi:MAG TPA: hypothetical protein VFA90_08280 [Terriglobales bacterium]|nr:hypothetical protein [Terriglobales bacterium]
MSAEYLRERQVSTSSVTIPTPAIASNPAFAKATLASTNPNLSFGSAALTGVQYPVSGVVGRCFLRVCLLAELMTSWTRRGHPYQPPLASTVTSEKQA